MNSKTLGILAHVDAGKTTLTEALLFETGTIRTQGRVDHKDTFLDTYDLEKSRGITIFSKQAVFKIENTNYCLVDTPGHIDFSAEMERAVSIMDYAILVISAADLVQSHTETIWNILKNYKVPVFIFINKMDYCKFSKEFIILQLQKNLSSACIDFTSATEILKENLAVSDDILAQYYFDNEPDRQKWLTQIKNQISKRLLFPCFFGSALYNEGIKDFIKGLHILTDNKNYVQNFQAKVYKILHDEQKNRLTFMKITGGKLKVKDSINEEKVNQIRIYSGNKFTTVNEVSAGSICAVTGLNNTFAGEIIGSNSCKIDFCLEPALSAKVIISPPDDPSIVVSYFKLLEQEEPELHVLWNETLKEIQINIMGKIQLEILKERIKERFNLNIDFGDCKILYKETIQNTVIGYGHFEPLRHYAEVHLKLEPADRGSGIILDNICKTDILDKNYQNLILTHLAEKEFKGILTGSPLTDVKITLLTGRSHIKHTEGGDFREATYRAVRQGLEKAENILLEPFYEFKIEIPSEYAGRAMSDIQRLYGEFSPPIINEDTAIIMGKGPIATFMNYPMEVNIYTKGKGHIYCKNAGYQPCHNCEEVIKNIGYDKDSDIDNVSSSVFCSHGAGFSVKWNEVEKYIHII